MSTTTSTHKLRDSLKPADGDNGPEYKKRLDEKAQESKSDRKKDEEQPSLVQKVASNIPGASSLLGENSPKGNQDATVIRSCTECEELSGPPVRPHHDCQIEEFVRDQHRSKNKGGVIE